MQNNFLFSSIAMGILLRGYFMIADHFNIIDKPNQRSSHTIPVIRGGGVIFLFGILLWFFQNSFQLPWFVLACAIIAIISFIDDVSSLPARVRFPIQLFSVLLLFYQLTPQWPIYFLIVAVIMCVGTINAFNFMDGINGITGVYALVTLCTFLYIDESMIKFSDSNLLTIEILSVLIFLFFNFRKRARCFAGDVGSVTIALILIFVLLQLIQTTNNFLWPLVFLVYGTDSIITIICRLKRKENIFKPHRTHLYQYLSNEYKIPHLVVSTGYGIMQGVINLILIYSFSKHDYKSPIVISVIYIIGYLLLRIKLVSRLKS